MVKSGGMTSAEMKKINIPDGPGCYLFLDNRKNIIYVGKAASLKKRVLSYWQKGSALSPAKSKMMNEVGGIDIINTDSEIEAFLLEANLIKKHKPYYNILLRDDKRHVYIKISTEDEIPGVFITRKIDKSGKYFGPFISSIAVRETIKAIRRIWPFCTVRRRQDKPCFYYQIGRCAGICGGIIGREEYGRRVIKPIELFLDGKKSMVLKRMEADSAKYDKMGDTEKSVLIKKSLMKMRNVLDHSRILSLADKYSSDVIELSKLLGLPRVPARIEGYDISETFGSEAVGSMAVFVDGEPEKSSYRRFRIRDNGLERGDINKLKEVLMRRFKRSKVTLTGKDKKSTRRTMIKAQVRGSDGWPQPDLLVIDGGKQQLNAAISVLNKYKQEIPVIAISKGDGLRSSRARDKLYFQGSKTPLELPLASPALHVIKRVRDEAHRFAIGYHRKLRSKRTFY